MRIDKFIYENPVGNQCIQISVLNSRLYSTYIYIYSLLSCDLIKLKKKVFKDTLNYYFKHFRLKPIPVKRLRSKSQVSLNIPLAYEKRPTKTAATLETRNCMFQKLADSEWGIDSITRWVSALSFIFPMV